MQLYISLTSPYARKAHMVVLEKGLVGAVQITPLNPWESPAVLTDKNPLSQVPVLVLDNGEILYDSRVICAYLDLRYADLEWRKRVPELAIWFETISKRPAMIATVPVL